MVGCLNTATKKFLRSVDVISINAFQKAIARSVIIQEQRKMFITYLCEKKDIQAQNLNAVNKGRAMSQENKGECRHYQVTDHGNFLNAINPYSGECCICGEIVNNIRQSSANALWEHLGKGPVKP